MVMLVITGLLSGCADNCSVLGGNRSFGCQVVLGAGFLLISTTFPFEAAKNAADEAKEREKYLKLKEGVKSGTRESLEECVLRCKNFLVFMDEKHQLRIEAERKLIALDEPSLPEAHVEAMMVAYESLAWEEGSDSVWHLNRQHVMRGWELAQQFWKRPQKSLFYERSSSYEDVPGELAKDVFVLHLLSLTERQIQPAVEGCVVQDNLPINPLKYYSFNRSLLCERAYITYLKIRNPANQNPQVSKELEARWNSDELVLDRARLADPLP